MVGVLRAIFLLRSAKRPWLPAVFWSVAAGTSIVIAILVAINRPGHLTDLTKVHGWLDFFNNQDGDPYAYFRGDLDYPPIALVVLWPLSLIPSNHLLEWYIPINIVITTLGCWALVRAVIDRLQLALPKQEIVAFVALVLSGSAIRGATWLGQTMGLSLVLGAACLWFARRRPWLAAVALALCTFKLHVAFAFAFALAATGSFAVVVIATCITIGLSLVAAFVLDQSLIVLIVSYTRNLTEMYGGSDRIRGLLSVRWVLEDLVGQFAVATLLYAAAAVGSAVVILAAARRARDATTSAQVIAACLMWPLLFLPSQLYIGVLAAPAVWMMIWPEARLIERDTIRLAIVPLWLIVGVIDLARLVRVWTAPQPDLHWLYQALYFLAPLRMGALFVLLLAAMHRRPRTIGATLPTAVDGRRDSQGVVR